MSTTHMVADKWIHLASVIKIDIIKYALLNSS